MGRGSPGRACLPLCSLIGHFGRCPCSSRGNGTTPPSTPPSPGLRWLLPLNHPELSAAQPGTRPAFFPRGGNIGAGRPDGWGWRGAGEAWGEPPISLIYSPLLQKRSPPLTASKGQMGSVLRGLSGALGDFGLGEGGAVGGVVGVPLPKACLSGFLLCMRGGAVWFEPPLSPDSGRTAGSPPALPKTLMVAL